MRRRKRDRRKEDEKRNEETIRDDKDNETITFCVVTGTAKVCSSVCVGHAACSERDA